GARGSTRLNDAYAGCTALDETGEVGYRCKLHGINRYDGRSSSLFALPDLLSGCTHDHLRELHGCGCHPDVDRDRVAGRYCNRCGHGFETDANDAYPLSSCWNGINNEGAVLVRSGSPYRAEHGGLSFSDRFAIRGRYLSANGSGFGLCMDARGCQHRGQCQDETCCQTTSGHDFLPGPEGRDTGSGAAPGPRAAPSGIERGTLAACPVRMGVAPDERVIACLPTCRRRVRRDVMPYTRACLCRADACPAPATDLRRPHESSRPADLVIKARSGPLARYRDVCLVWYQLPGSAVQPPFPRARAGPETRTIQMANIANSFPSPRGYRPQVA